MKKVLKKCISLLLALTAATLLIAHPIETVNAVAIEETQVQPRWMHVNSIVLTLDVTTSPLYFAITVAGAMGTTYSNGTIRLLRDGVQIAKWTGLSATTPFFSFSNEDITRYSGTYELQFSITATRNGTSETVSSFKTAKY